MFLHRKSHGICRCPSHIAKACLKNHSRNLHAPLCGIFCLNSIAVARAYIVLYQSF
ncbi:DUF6783 domain-containing protein [Blautia sp.]